MEDLIVRIPRSDATFVAQLLEKMGYTIRNKAYQGKQSQSFMPLFNAMRQNARQDHEWTLDEINAEIAAARQARIEKI